MPNKYERMHKPYSKDWCQGFCRSCGTACGDYCQQIHELNERLTAALLENSSLKRSNRDLLEAASTSTDERVE